MALRVLLALPLGAAVAIGVAMVVTRGDDEAHASSARPVAASAADAAAPPPRATDLAALRSLRDEHAASVAARALKQSAEEGDVAAQLLLGKALREGVPGIAKDQAAACAWLRRASDAGNASAAYYLGIMTNAGEGTLPDPREGIRWLETAASRGSPHAAFLLGNAYRSGAGVARSDAKALEYYVMAAERELPAALQALAMAHLYGELGLPPDEAEYHRYALEAEHAIGHPPREP